MEFIDGEFEYEHSELEEMEMPTPCQKCDGWFDLNDGVASEKWFPRTVICSECGEKEQNIIELEQDIEDLQDEINDAEDSISNANETIPIMKNFSNTIVKLTDPDYPKHKSKYFNKPQHNFKSKNIPQKRNKNNNYNKR